MARDLGNTKIGVGDGGGIPDTLNVPVSPPPSPPSNSQVGKHGESRGIAIGVSSDDWGIRVKVGNKVYNLEPRQMFFVCAVANALDKSNLENSNVSISDKVTEVANKLGISDKTLVKWLGNTAVKGLLKEKIQDIAVDLFYDGKRWKRDAVDQVNGDIVRGKNATDMLKELGMRVSPKIEKVQHEFEDVDFIFAAKKSE